MNQDFDTALTDWLKRAQQIINDYFVHMNYSFPQNTLSIDPRGVKYIRIISTDPRSGAQHVHCFIERATGNVLKAATWKAPAQHARGTIWEVGKEGVSPHGALYLQKTFNTR